MPAAAPALERLSSRFLGSSSNNAMVVARLPSLRPCGRLWKRCGPSFSPRRTLQSQTSTAAHHRTWLPSMAAMCVWPLQTRATTSPLPPPFSRVPWKRPWLSH